VVSLTVQWKIMIRLVMSLSQLISTIRSPPPPPPLHSNVSEMNIKIYNRLLRSSVCVFAKMQMKCGFRASHFCSRSVWLAMELNYINCVNGDTYIFPYMEHNAKTESQSHFSFVFAHSLNLNYTPTTINYLYIVVSLLLCSPPGGIHPTTQ
jgi:hypothetical protein